MDCFGTYFTEWTASVHTLHMSKPNVTRVQRATEWTASVHTLHMSKPNVTRVQSATPWTASVHLLHMSTASVHTLHMSKPNVVKTTLERCGPFSLVVLSQRRSQVTSLSGHSDQNASETFSNKLQLNKVQSSLRKTSAKTTQVRSKAKTS